LLDALDHGFTSVEADIFLVNGELLVGHSPFELRPGRTLDILYLKPLADRAAAHEGVIQPGGDRFILLIDIKSKAEPTYRALAEALAKYPDLFGRLEDGAWKTGPVTVVVSGNRPVEVIAADPARRVGIDGRTADLDAKHPAHLMPMISDAWGAQFQWKGKGPIPPAERSRLCEYCEKAHRDGRVVRFWATPEDEIVWKELADAGVDLLNTDQLARMRTFLTAREKSAAP
jgi:glycerophosphoryl diester phosphodiesterase